MFAVLEEPRQLTRTTVQAESVLAIDVEHVKRDATLPVNSGVMKIGEAPPWGPTDSVKKIAGSEALNSPGHPHNAWSAGASITPLPVKPTLCM